MVLIQGLVFCKTYALSLKFHLSSSAPEHRFFPARQLAVTVPPWCLHAQDRSQNASVPGRRQNLSLRTHLHKVTIGYIMISVWLINTCLMRLIPHRQQHYTHTEVAFKSLIQTVDSCTEWRLYCTVSSLSDLRFTYGLRGWRVLILR